MKFDLHLSRNYKGDPYHWPYGDAESAGEVRWWIQDFWEFSELTTPSTEAILYAEIGTSAKLQKLATVSYDTNGILCCLLSMEDSDAVTVLAKLGYVNGGLIRGNKSFERLIDVLLLLHPSEE